MGEQHDRCIDCDGTGHYPTGKQCRSCADNPGRVLKGDGEPIAKNAPCVVCTGTKDCEIYGCFEGRRL